MDIDKNLPNYPLNVPAPHHYTFAVRDVPTVTIEQRERALKDTHYNEFAFPAGMLTIDMLSDSGTTAMTNHQWAALFLGDEAYGRNTGYYVLLDTFRDIFERGGEKNIVAGVAAIGLVAQEQGGPLLVGHAVVPESDSMSTVSRPEGKENSFQWVAFRARSRCSTVAWGRSRTAKAQCWGISTF